MGTPEPGWYPDPTDGSAMRYFNGSAWTADTRPVPPVAGTRIEVPDAPEHPAPPDTQGMAPSTSSTLAQKRHRRWPLVAAILLVVSVVVALLVYRAAQPSRLEAAFAECGMADQIGARITDGGHTVILDQKGDEDGAGLDITEIGCFLYAVDMPDAITAQMDSTRALDGRQSDEFDGITVSWSYHPDTGIDIVFEDR